MKSNTISIILLFSIFILNFGHSYKSIENYLYQGTFSNVIDEIFESLRQNEVREPSGVEPKKIGDILSIQPGIEDSYVMTGDTLITNYANSKRLFASLQEGVRNDTLENYITRKNWSEFDLFFSDISSHPANMMKTYKPIPDYLVYIPHYLLTSTSNNTQYEDLKILSDPNNVKIPSNFQPIYKSNKTGIIVYKISHQQ